MSVASGSRLGHLLAYGRRQMQFHFTRKRLFWGALLALAFGGISYNNILTGRWPRSLGIAMMVLLPAFTLFSAFTGKFTKETFFSGSPEQCARAPIMARNKVVIWAVTFVIAYLLFKLNDAYHLFAAMKK
jgi:hypothetical protein